MPSETNNDLKYVNLVSRIMDSCFQQDEEDHIFSYPTMITAAEFLHSKPTMAEENFSGFIEYMKRERNAEYQAIETMLRKGYRWEDPFSSDFGGNAFRKLAYGPEYLLRFYKDYEFIRTGDYGYAASSMRKISNVALVCTALYGLINPFAFLLCSWQIGGALISLEKMISAPLTGDDDFPKIVKRYAKIHKRTRFYILDKVQDYILQNMAEE
ncbi:MAG: hypothetical protein KAT43_05645 [Nanoarchaeota archaeon]|nr:hypothetical protein [Nanoarchaeota archaeon]